jgi:hypothetical protein
MNRVRVQQANPTIEEAQYKGYCIKVVAGYNIQGDNYLVHLYISPPAGPEVRVFEPPRAENNLDDALSIGFFEAKCEIDQLVP